MLRLVLHPRKALLLCGASALCAMTQLAAAQSELDRLLSSVEVSSEDNCHTVDITLNRPVTFAGRFPVGTGRDIAIRVDVLSLTQTGEDGAARKETASLSAGNEAGLSSVSFDPVATGPALLLDFDHPVHFEVSRDSNSRHIVVFVSDTASGCAPTDDGAKVDLGGTGDSSLGEAKKSLSTKDYPRAVALLTKSIEKGDAASRREARELMGLARERAGQLAQAKAAYQAYLKAYPSGADAERVKQRLSGVLAAIESEASDAYAAAKKTNLAGKNGAVNATMPKMTISPGKADRVEPKGWQWQTSGSVGQYYYRNDGYAGLGMLRGTLGTHDLNQNDIVSTADVTVRGVNGASEFKARISTYNQTGLGGTDGEDRTSLSTAYVDMRNRLNGLSARIGRQTGNGGGVFGRYDGALLGWDVSEIVALHAVVGSPVYYGDSEPFADGRYFAGLSLDLSTADKTWSSTLYAIEQDVDGAVDRRALGAELRYAHDRVTAYAAADYDIYFNEINTAYVSGSWAVRNDLSIYGTLDYRHVPFLLTSNALIGQSTDSLSSLIDLFGSHDAEALAVDRTASAATATAGITYDISDTWQASLEASIADYSGTPASGGVDAIPDPGMEYYLSAQLDGSGIFTDDDYVGLGLRFLDSESYRTYIADFILRYPVNDKLRLSPRLRIAYRDGQSADLEQIMIMPSLGLKYQVADHWALEGEVAARWEDNATSAGHDQNGEFLVTLGYRYTF